MVSESSRSGGSGDGKQGEGSARRDRLAEALRSNLKRRKAQSRGRQQEDQSAAPPAPTRDPGKAGGGT